MVDHPTSANEINTGLIRNLRRAPPTPGVGIEDERLPVLQAQAQGIPTLCSVECITQLPGDDKAAEPIKNMDFI